ncbi:MAG: glutamine synthetase family protein [Odoribacteraceae bacterium]|jgi:glutamine synthetase|nr:glutamine synthetase family protein [Odoribacteraceae bacterium]
MGQQPRECADALARFLGKDRRSFTKADIIRYILANHIEVINLRYAGADGRLKTLNIVFHDLDYLDAILSCGERVDGSSLFPSIPSGESDLYVVPRYRTAFLNPFTSIPALDILCSYYTKDGTPLETSPEYTLRKAREALGRATGYMDYEVMGELEYYVASNAPGLFPADDQRGYHESDPFNKSGELRVEAMRRVVEAGGQIKYGHSEVGNFTRDGVAYEQNEIEFLPAPVDEAADQLVIAKWMLRVLAHRRGMNLTFAPKITDGKAGNGLHVHTRLKKGGENRMVKDGKLSDDALRAISGYLDLAPALTAFGNANPASYLRLVPHQEAPTLVCWGDRNRSALVRVPLGWTGNANGMITDANPRETRPTADFSQRQTVEFRSPDGSADIYLLLAGLTVAVRHGFETPDAIARAKARYADANDFAGEHQALASRLEQLPASCFESANCLQARREIFEQHGVFSPALVDATIANLRQFNDQHLREEIKTNPGLVMELVRRHFYCG